MVNNQSSSRAIKIAAMVFVVGGAITGAFHFALICGAPWGQWTMGGKWSGQLPLEGRLVSAASIVILAMMSWIVASTAGYTKWKPSHWFLKAVLVYMLIATALHVITPSVQERALWLPIILIMTTAIVTIFVKMKHKTFS